MKKTICLIFVLIIIQLENKVYSCERALETIDYLNKHNAWVTQDSLKNKNDTTIRKKKYKYISLAIGAGTSYGGFGVRFQQRFGKKIGFAYHVGLGYIPSPNSLNGVPGFTFGGKLFWSRLFYADLQSGIMGIGHSYGENFNSIVYGSALMIGCDWSSIHRKDCNNRKH
jgi:hypothetical protein